MLILSSYYTSSKLVATIVAGCWVLGAGCWGAGGLGLISIIKTKTLSSCVLPAEELEARARLREQGSNY